MSVIISIDTPDKTRHQHRRTITEALRRLSQKPRSDDEVSAVIYKGRWDQLPVVLAQLIPRFSDVKVRRMVREPTLWEGAYEESMQGD
jgi:hypothetical protein